MAPRIHLKGALVGKRGNDFGLKIDENAEGNELKKVIKKTLRDDDTLRGVAHTNMQVFLAKKHGAWLKQADMTSLALDQHGCPRDCEEVDYTLPLNHADNFVANFQAVQGEYNLLVVIPRSKRSAEEDISERDSKRQKVEWLTTMETLTVDASEFNLGNLATVQPTNRPVVDTRGLHEFWKDYGGFPTHYFVRREEVVLWEVVKTLLPNVRMNRLVIVGSPGVGKTCFLMLMAFYMACAQKKKVLVLRRLKTGDLRNSVVLLNGDGTYNRLQNATREMLADIRAETKGAIVLVDGYEQSDVQAFSNQLEPFHCLATSCQFDAEDDDSAQMVVLPAWRRGDLLQYAKLTGWVTDTNLRVARPTEDKRWWKLVKKQYFYSGGSLREFRMEPRLLRIRANKKCDLVGTAQALELVYSYHGGQSSGQVDRVRRHYITDRDNAEHYYDSGYWTLSVDSGYILSKLGQKISLDQQLNVYTYANQLVPASLASRKNNCFTK